MICVEWSGGYCVLCMLFEYLVLVVLFVVFDDVLDELVVCVLIFGGSLLFVIFEDVFGVLVIVLLIVNYDNV